MRAIFISYRRSDSEGEAGRLSDLLTSRFSDQSVFMDVDSIQPGRDFRRAIEESILACSVVLVLIGPGWLNAATPDGTRRLDAPNDYVRLEIAAALRRDIPVIPILIRGARMPAPEHLPQEIHELAYRNSVELTHARWKSDLQILIEALEKLLQKPPAEPVPPARPVYAPAPAPADPAYLHSTPPAILHTPVTSRPGPSARRAAHAIPLPPSPFAAAETVYPLLKPTGSAQPSLAVNPSSSQPPPHLPPAQPFVRAQLQPQTQIHNRTQNQPAASPPMPPPPEAPMRREPEFAAAPTAATPIDQAAIDRVTRQLAHFIGPIAEIVVRRAAKKAASESDLCASVSHEIESAPDRGRFLAQVRK